MWVSCTNGCGLGILMHSCVSLLPFINSPILRTTSTSLLLINFKILSSMENNNSSFSPLSVSSPSRKSHGGRGKGMEKRDDGQRTNGGRGGSSPDKIDALGRLLTRILRHIASELNLNMRSDGYVKVSDVLKLNMKTFVDIPIRSHTVEDIREAVRRDNKQRFSLLEENDELLIRANQGHTVKTIESENLLKPILSIKEAPVCVHGTYKKNLESILQSGLKPMKRLHVHFTSGLPSGGEIISGMRRDVNILIFLDVRKALGDGLKLYISDNKVILTEGVDGVVPVKYFEKIETWPGRQPIYFKSTETNTEDDLNIEKFKNLQLGENK
ncbi:hypothetical protein IFM89_039035 [Coptis chinensis]|uniref:2'-phosphotransferase n=1 Tax=Coptis chinensis TaxID=261450 RepID=A0A835IJS2_9MAGN|nr:hypothetical protein IFM89_039035 [Coptis chinensis]